MKCIRELFRVEPAEAIKRHIRDLEDQVPEINEGLALIKAQVTLVEKERAKLLEREAELVAKVEGAEGQGRPDMALNYSATLAEVRRELALQDQQLGVAREAFEKAQRVKHVFMEEKERKIQGAKAALAAQRQTEWNERVLSSLASWATHDRGDMEFEDLVQRSQAAAASSEARLNRVLERVVPVASAEPAELRHALTRLQAQIQGLEQRLDSARDQIRTFEQRLTELEG